MKEQEENAEERKSLDMKGTDVIESQSQDRRVEDKKTRQLRQGATDDLGPAENILLLLEEDWEIGFVEEFEVVDALADGQNASPLGEAEQLAEFLLLTIAEVVPTEAGGEMQNKTQIVF